MLKLNCTTFINGNCFHIIFFSLTIGFFSEGYAQSIPGRQAAGRWDITVSTSNGSYPSWLEINKSGHTTLIGRFVGRSGSARPVSEIKFTSKTQKYSFTIPTQWYSRKAYCHFEFSLKKGQLIGWMIDPEGKKLQWTGVRAPSPDQNRKSPIWGTPIHLLQNGLSNWKVPENSEWTINNGILLNKRSGGNLITNRKFMDFKLHIEFRYPKGSNSGIFLRGRHEVQVKDSYGKVPNRHSLGALYGYIVPSTNVAKKSGKWQTFDITLTGRMISIILNGTKIICNRPIQGISGDALNSKEGKPGPIQLQGDHGRVEYRNIVLTPSK